MGSFSFASQYNRWVSSNSWIEKMGSFVDFFVDSLSKIVDSCYYETGTIFYCHSLFSTDIPESLFAMIQTQWIESKYCSLIPVLSVMMMRPYCQDVCVSVLCISMYVKISVVVRLINTDMFYIEYHSYAVYFQ